MRRPEPLPPTPYPGRPDPGRRETLWTRVERNRLLLVAYLGLFMVAGAVWFALQTGAGVVIAFLLLLRSSSPEGTGWLASVLGGGVWPALLRLAAVGGAITAIYEVRALMRSERAIAKRIGAELVPTGDLYNTKMLVKDMAIAAGLPIAPALYMIPGRGVNALVIKAIGRRPIIAVTEKLLERLNPDEQRAVFANLTARIVSGDALVATALTGLLGPLEEWRDRGLREDRTLINIGNRNPVVLGENGEMARILRPNEEARALFFVFSFAFIFLGEIAAAVHRRSQLRAAEKADAEGMLLLKDPSSMLSALEHCVYFDNLVSRAGDGFGELFYCWPGESTNDDDDPEWERVKRLREVLGVDGMVGEGPVGPQGEPYFPVAPRIEQRY